MRSGPSAPASLVVGQITSSGGSEELKVRVNPISYTGGGASAPDGIVDNIVISNDANAESQALSGVTPEPSSLALAAGSALGLLSRRRRRAS